MACETKSAQGYLFNTKILAQNKNGLELADASRKSSGSVVVLHHHTFLTWLVVWPKYLLVPLKLVRLDFLLYLFWEVTP